MKKIVAIAALLAALGSASALAGPSDALSCSIHGGNAAPTACGGW